MLKHLTLAAVLLAAAAPMAHAQDYDDNGADQAEQQDSGPGPQDRGPDADRAPMERDMRHGDRWNNDRWARDRRDDDRGPRAERRGPPRGPEGRRGPPPPPPARVGFAIEMGPNGTVRVNCGDEAFADCVDAAKPILDVAREMAAAPRGPHGPGAQVPPPPGGLVAPANGDAPPPPAAGGEPTPPPAN